MGWSNYIIIDKWKMIIETNREVDELEDYIEHAIDNIIDNDIDVDVDTSDLKINSMTVKDLCIMAFLYENASALCGLHIDKLLLYWLKHKNIDYDTKSEYNIDVGQYKDKGYKIISIWGPDDDNDQDNNNQNNVKEDNIRPGNIALEE